MTYFDYVKIAIYVWMIANVVYFWIENKRLKTRLKTDITIARTDGYNEAIEASGRLCEIAIRTTDHKAVNETRLLNELHRSVIALRVDANKRTAIKLGAVRANATSVSTTQSYAR